MKLEELKIIEKLRGYLVVEFENKYFRLCNFTYENNIYTKKITNSQAQNMITSIFNNRCNYKTFKLVAHQLGVRV